MGYKFIPKQLLGSVYSIDELKENFSKVRVGDTINYEINGYSDWQVLYTDIDNGTIDVVSKTNTEDLALEYGQSKEYYENKFQETANKYTDDNYAISARTVNSSDLDYFNYDNNFWLNNISDTNIITSQSTFEINPKNYKLYVVPYIEKYFENYNEYNVGDTIEYSNNGVDRWVVAEIEPWNSSTLILIPETPIELVIESADDSISEKANQIIDSFNIDVSNYGNYVNTFGTDNLPNLIQNFLNQQTERIYFYDGAYYFKNSNKIKFKYNSTPYYESGEFGRYGGNCYSDECAATIYTEQGPRTLGYRPIVTLKVKEAKEGKELSSKLKVGDNVKYEAKGYKNWKVLSVDEDNNTVDIISGGIVKNLTLSGEEDWENFEDILQRETDKYKNGDNVVGTKILEAYDIKLLEQMRDKVIGKYYYNYKNKINRKTVVFESSAKANVMVYYVGVMNYDLENGLVRSMISLDTNIIGDAGVVNYYKSNGTDVFEVDYEYITFGSITYAAGLRPIITLKLDSVEKLNESETKKVEESSKKLDKTIYQEQTSKNKNYKAPSIVDDESSKGTKKDNKNSENNASFENDNYSNNNITNDLKGISKGLFWYIIISITLLNIISIVILLFVTYLAKKRT